MESLRCDWRLFSDTSKDCLVCEDHEKCRAEKLFNDPAYQNYLRMKTEGVVEDDAKEYAEFIREWDRMNNELLLSELGIGGIEQEMEEEGELASAKKKVTKGFRELEPFIKFLDAENIPYIFQEPNDLYVSSFMMLSYSSAGITIRLTAMAGVPTDIKFMRQDHRGSVTKKQYKYVKKSDANTIMTIVRSVIFSKKGNETR